MIAQELEGMRAPRKVVDAGREIDAATTAGIRPAMELVCYVRAWVTRNRGNNRYGR